MIRINNPYVRRDGSGITYHKENNMEQMSAKDRERLRELAKQRLEFANCPKNEEITKKWIALAEGRKESPTVRLLFSNFGHEVITPRM